MSLLLVLLCFYLGSVHADQKDLPKYIEKCSLKHDFKQCFIRSAEKAVPFIVKGDPEYNIPNMMPLHVSFINLISNDQLALNLTDNHVYGLDNAKVVDVIIDKKNRLFLTPIFKIPNITLNGQYSVKGNVLALSLNGKGLYTVSLLNGVYKYPLLIEKVTSNGVDYYQTKGKTILFDFEDVVFDIGNFLDGDVELGKQFNKLLADNWQFLLEEFRPTISETVNTIISGIFNKIAKDVPAKDVFLPD